MAELRGEIEEHYSGTVPQTEVESRPSFAAAACLRQLEGLAEDIIFVADTLAGQESAGSARARAGVALEDDLATSVLRAAKVLRKEQERRAGDSTALAEDPHAKAAIESMHHHARTHRQLVRMFLLNKDLGCAKALELSFVFFVLTLERLLRSRAELASERAAVRGRAELDVESKDGKTEQQGNPESTSPLGAAAG